MQWVSDYNLYLYDIFYFILVIIWCIQPFVFSHFLYNMFRLLWLKFAWLLCGVITSKPSSLLKIRYVPLPYAFIWLGTERNGHPWSLCYLLFLHFFDSLLRFSLLFLYRALWRGFGKQASWIVHIILIKIYFLNFPFADLAPCSLCWHLSPECSLFFWSLHQQIKRH